MPVLGLTVGPRLKSVHAGGSAGEGQYTEASGGLLAIVSVGV